MSVPALVVGIATASTYVTPIDAGASWLFFGISLIVAAFRGDAGCEVLALANVTSGHRELHGMRRIRAVDLVDSRLGGPRTPTGSQR